MYILIKRKYLRIIWYGQHSYLVSDLRSLLFTNYYVLVTPQFEMYTVSITHYIHRAIDFVNRYLTTLWYVDHSYIKDEILTMTTKLFFIFLIINLPNFSTRLFEITGYSSLYSLLLIQPRSEIFSQLTKSIQAKLSPKWLKDMFILQKIVILYFNNYLCG